MDGTLQLLARRREELSPGAVHVPDWLTLDEQRDLVERWRVWAQPPAPMHRTRMRNGGVMSTQTVCLGWHWLPYRYVPTADDVDGAPVTPMPASLVELGRRAVAAAYDDETRAAGYEPDVALVNFYDATARMGLHRDRDEACAEPVVSLSIGDSCVFRFGNDQHRGRPHRDIELRSGDLFVFGGAARLAYHGVARIRPGTGDPRTGLGGGRLNITMRITGLGRPVTSAVT